ncbi:MAG: efflux RND transporter periplasmic adaptor subunit [Acidobacteriota bacterium]|nr:efflux RND transporter periplasmic adaptor subunit [Acidobacteriota bacterium]
MASETEVLPPIAPPAGPAPPAKPVHAKWRWLAYFSLFAGLAAAATVWLLSDRTPPAQFLTARIDRGNIDATVTTSGNLNAVITVQVGSQVSGNIIALYADFNTKVKKGQLVAEIDPAPFKAAVDQSKAVLSASRAAAITAEATLAKGQSDYASAEAAVAAQQSNLEKARSVANLARVENERRQVMVKTGSTSQEDADTAQANYEQAVSGVSSAEAAVRSAQAVAESARKGIDVARAQLTQARAVVVRDEAALAQAQLNLDHTRILAPVDGTVQSRNMDVGQTVAASFQAPVIFLIAQDLTKMQVDTNVDEADVGPIEVGQKAAFTVDAYPGQTFSAEVAQIRKAPINVQNVITYDVVVAVANPDLKLFPGMTANVTIYTGHAGNVLRIPKAALRFRPRGAAPPASQQTVYVPGTNGQAVAVPVRTGLANATHVELVSGNLTEGRQVITGMPSKQTPPSASAPGGTRKLGF